MTNAGPDRDQIERPAKLATALLLGNGGLLAAVLVFSVLVNLLMLTGPMFMLQVYDRVLASRASATLSALFAIVAFLYVMMAVLDHARTRIMTRIGARFQVRLDRRVFEISLQRLSVEPSDSPARLAQRDLETVQRLLASPALMGLIDIPWTPLFVALLFVFHPNLGLLALAGGAVLVIVALVNQRALRVPLIQMSNASQRAERGAAQIGNESELVRALGMTGAAFDRWQDSRGAALAASVSAGDWAGLSNATTRAFRLFLQSAMLALGAWLVLRDQLSPGLMVAASIILGRALAPVEQLVAQWGVLQAGAESWRRLRALLSAHPPLGNRTSMPRPRARLSLQGVTVAPPGQNHAALKAIAFELEPGRALGVIGPSGAGKSSLARTVIGAWPSLTGKVRIDGVALDQFDPEELGRMIGYLPQRVCLFDGTIAENIARLDPRPDPAAIICAARRAGAHEMIVALPQGYDTPVSENGARLSGGQVQRINLARALYGDPLLLVLDEPNSNLDSDGALALNASIRTVKAEGGAVMVMAHRPAAIQECDDLLVLEQGHQIAFGPRDAVLRQVVRNHTDIVRNAARPKAANAPSPDRDGRNA